MKITETKVVRGIALFAMIVLINGVIHGTMNHEPKVAFNGGYCIECGGHLELDYKCGSTYVFRCEDCYKSVQTHT